MHELNIIFMRMENFEIQNHELCVDRNCEPIYFCWRHLFSSEGQHRMTSCV